MGPKSKKILGESFKTKKTKQKLLKRFKEIDAKITEAELGKKSIEIHSWISKNAAERKTLRDKSIALFDENQNIAKISEKVAKLAERLRSSK